MVIHTNEGGEGRDSAENLAGYLARPNVEPGYHVVVDENSAVLTCPLTERCYGAGGVNPRAFHICITGYAKQSAAEWADASSRPAVARAAAIAQEMARVLGIPWQRITDPRSQRGICGHADVSRYYSASDGHSDPGAHFPWDLFMRGTSHAKPTSKRKRKMQFLYNVPGTKPVYITDGVHTRWVSSPKRLEALQFLLAASGLEAKVGTLSWDDHADLVLVGKVPPG